MSINANITRVVSSSRGAGGNNPLTGSFSKIYVMEAATFSRIDFGTNRGTRFEDQHDRFGGTTRTEVSNIVNLVTNVQATAGSYIEGPIASFRLSAGSVLAYDTSNPDQR